MGWNNDQLISLRLPQDAQPNDPQILIGPELPPCMAGDFTAAAFWIPPDSQIGVLANDAPLFFIGQQTVTGGGSQTVTEGFVFYDPTISACGYVVTRRYVASGPPGSMLIVQNIGPVPALGSGITMLIPMQLLYTDTTVTFDTGSKLVLDAASTFQVDTDIDWNGCVTLGNTQTAAFNSTSAAYTSAGGALCGVAFTAPPSGAVVFNYGARVVNNGAANSSFVAPVIKTGSVIGSGTAIIAASDGRSVDHEGLSPSRQGAAILSNLTPGTAYNAYLEHKVSAGTGTFSQRSVVVQPAF